MPPPLKIRIASRALESDRRLKRNAALALVMALLAAAILALYVCLELYALGTCFWS